MSTKKSSTNTAAKKAVAKKVVAKKAPAKKVVAKKVAKKTVKKAPQTPKKKTLVYSPNSASFWVTNGQILNSLVALRDALAEMEKEAYLYHATGEHNDFANWVAAVLCDEACAKDLEKAKTPASAKTVVVKHLKYYEV